MGEIEQRVPICSTIITEGGHGDIIRLEGMLNKFHQQIYLGAQLRYRCLVIQAVDGLVPYCCVTIGIHVSCAILQIECLHVKVRFTR